MSDNENKGLPLTIKIIIGILIAIVAVIVGFVFIIANTIRKAGNEKKMTMNVILITLLYV